MVTALSRVYLEILRDDLAVAIDVTYGDRVTRPQLSHWPRLPVRVDASISIKRECPLPIFLTVLGPDNNEAFVTDRLHRTSDTSHAHLRRVLPRDGGRLCPWLL